MENTWGSLKQDLLSCRFSWMFQMARREWYPVSGSTHPKEYVCQFRSSSYTGRRNEQNTYKQMFDTTNQPLSALFHGGLSQFNVLLPHLYCQHNSFWSTSGEKTQLLVWAKMSYITINDIICVYIYIYSIHIYIYMCVCVDSIWFNGDLTIFYSCFNHETYGVLDSCGFPIWRGPQTRSNVRIEFDSWRSWFVVC